MLTNFKYHFIGKSWKKNENTGNYSISWNIIQYGENGIKKDFAFFNDKYSINII